MKIMQGITNYIACVSEQQAKRLLIFFDDSEEVHYKTIVLAFISGVYRQ
jgi:transcription-repair coupling factor (superfamily II helicase)